MEKLDLRYYLFHAIEHVSVKSGENSYDHLDCFLQTGYIYPGREVQEHLPLEYRDRHYGSMSPHVYFALIENHLFPPSITNRFGEFSAFSEEIIGNLAFMFDESILHGQKIVFLPSLLSNEVLLSSKVPISMAQAFYFPYEFPFDLVEQYQKNIMEESSFFGDEFTSINEKLRQQISLILDDPVSCLDTLYQPIDEIRTLLLQYQYNIPIVSECGRVLNKEEETKYFVKHYEEVKSLIKN